MKCRKRPVEVDAYWFSTFNSEPYPEWLTDALDRGEATYVRPDIETMCIAIRTLEGEMRADDGDYIIRGIKGELYPCKRDIFEATYDRI